jgi:hypothetical protein
MREMKILSSLKTIFIAIAFVSLSATCIAKSKQDDAYLLSCKNNPKLQELRSNELKLLEKKDQEEKQNFDIKSEQGLSTMFENDLKRRKRVGAMFAEGCINSTTDYMAAALIYQHGDMPDHFYQTYVWANKAYQLGDKNASRWIALSIDRYLINTGKKQLFGTQYFNANIASEASCYCMQPVEPAFPDSLRIQYLGQTLRDSYDLLATMNISRSCALKQADCDTPLASPAKRQFSGIW